jgi:hypothetical protein
VSFENYEANGYMHDLDLLIIFHELCVSYPTKSGSRYYNIHLRHISLTYLGQILALPKSMKVMMMEI